METTCNSCTWYNLIALNTINLTILPSSDIFSDGSQVELYLLPLVNGSFVGSSVVWVTSGVTRVEKFCCPWVVGTKISCWTLSTHWPVSWSSLKPSTHSHTCSCVGLQILATCWRNVSISIYSRLMFYITWGGGHTTVTNYTPCAKGFFLWLDGIHVCVVFRESKTLNILKK